VSLNKLSNVFGISKDTIAVYIGYMINAYLIYEVRYFSYSAKIKHDVTKLPKIYAADLGLVNAINIRYSKNKGQMFENAVLVKLLESYDEVYYWSELETEADFIAGDMAINVTATDNINKRELFGLEKFRRKHNKFKVVLVTESRKEEKMIPIKEFLSAAD
jgi:predicted AAA+ superfamily ATPase